MNIKVKGIVCGIIAAITYGTNPLGVLPLYKLGIHVDSVLFYRYSIAALILGLIMLFKRESFKINRKEFVVLTGLGVLFALSSLTLFISFHYMDAGIASTVLFVYPIFVALLMMVFFKEKLTRTTVVSILLAVTGVFLLNYSNQGMLSVKGTILVLGSAFSYASYIVVVNKAELKMSPVKLTFYALLSCIVTVLIHSQIATGQNIQMLTTPFMWSLAIGLAIVPTVMSLVLMAVAVYHIGSTPTAIMGALEPLTAVIIGVVIFNETLSAQLLLGIVFILSSVLYLVLHRKRFPRPQISAV